MKSKLTLFPVSSGWEAIGTRKLTQRLTESEPHEIGLHLKMVLMMTPILTFAAVNNKVNINEKEENTLPQLFGVHN